MTPSTTHGLVRLLGLIGVAASLASCTLVPGKLERVAHKHASGARLGHWLEKALEDPGSEESDDALGHFVAGWKEQGRPARGGQLVVREAGGGERTYRVQFAAGGHDGYPLSYFDSLSPASHYRTKGIEHYRIPGHGAPMVALRENEQREPVEKFYPPEAITRPLTAVIRDKGMRSGIREIEVDLLCPLRSGTVTVDGRRQPLAADFSVPWAALLERTADLKRSGLGDLFSRNPGREPQLYMLEPYEPHKEPLIMIHGLMDTPLVWTEVSNELWADEEIRNRYQIWHFLYNTSAPALYSGRVLQTQLRELRRLLNPGGRDPAMQRTTIIAHSMGGIVTRRLTTRPGDVFWEAAFTQPLESLTLSDSDRKSLQEAFFWQAEPSIHRVIYIAVPHRGSNYSDNFIGRIGRWLVNPPNRFEAFYSRISSANPGAFTPAYAELGQGRLDSVDALSPRQPTLHILNKLPNAHPIEEHSIIANRGRKGPPEASSDGIVEYWSSHLDRARSEKLVPDGHDCVDHPETLGEIKRILRQP